MVCNDILRRLRFALDIADDAMINIFELGGEKINHEKLLVFLAKEEESGFSRCPDGALAAFLDGLIILRRGKKETPDGATPKGAGAPGGRDLSLSNNLILKKIRIALELKEDDMLRILKTGGMEISSGELTAIFRKPGHKHYRECQDQMLRTFLKGLTTDRRGL